MSDNQTVTGICTEIAQKPGSEWTEFYIDAGGKYPVRLSTKLQPLIVLGRAVGSNLATWTYNEVESEKINEKSGKPYVNRYLEGVEIGGAPTPEGETPARPPVLGGDKDRLIVRQVCVKAAAELIASRPPEDIEEMGLEVMKQAARFETWIYRGLEPPPF